jgi:hypothetical protein
LIVPTHGRAKIATAAAVAAGALTLATGLAVAVDLPDQASDTAEERVAEAHATTTTSSTTTTTLATTTTVGTNTDDVDAEGAGARPTDTHGYVVSTFATTTDLEGREKGEAISDLASDHAQSGGATTGTVTAEEHRSAERGKSAEHRPADD